MKEHNDGSSNYYNKNLFNKLKELENNNIIEINKIVLDYFNFGGPGSCGTLIKWSKK